MSRKELFIKAYCGMYGSTPTEAEKRYYASQEWFITVVINVYGNENRRDSWED